jgi:uncharacterized membrane protein
MIAWIILGIFAVVIVLTVLIWAMLRGIKEHDQCLEEDQHRAWAEYQARYGKNTQIDLKQGKKEDKQ